MAPSSVLCCSRIVAARPGPIPFAPGILSEESPRRRDEVRHLLRIDAVALAHLGGTDAVELADAAPRQQHRRPLARELEEVAVARQHERLALALPPARAAAARKSSAS